MRFTANSVINNCTNLECPTLTCLANNKNETFELNDLTSNLKT